MIFKIFTRFVIVFTFVQLLTSATPCGFREHKNDEMDGNKEQYKKFKRQLEGNQLLEVAKEATPESTKEATPDSTEEVTPESESTKEATPVSTEEVTPESESTKEATPDLTKEAEMPENSVIANEEQSNDSLELSEGQGAGNGELSQDPIPEVKIPEIPVIESPTPEEQPKNETEVSDDVRPIPINHRLSPNTTILGKIKNMFSKVKTWLVGS